jgi:hypothetical protein
MSQDNRHHHKFLHDTIKTVDENPKELSPILKEFKEMVDKDTRLYMLFNNMFEEVSCEVPAGSVLQSVGVWSAAHLDCDDDTWRAAFRS